MFKGNKSLCFFLIIFNFLTPAYFPYNFLTYLNGTIVSNYRPMNIHGIVNSLANSIGFSSDKSILAFLLIPMLIIEKPKDPRRLGMFL